MANATLPKFQTTDQSLSLLQASWAALINPLLNRPQLNSIILPSVSLTTGSNTIAHRLGRVLQGWSVTRQRSAATIYDNQDANSTPDLTLILVSSANVVVNIECF